MRCECNESPVFPRCSKYAEYCIKKSEYEVSIKDEEV